MELNLSFGGFYYSVHSDIVDSLVESNFDEDDDTLTEEEYYDTIDYRKIHKEYCKYYVKYLFDYILDVHGIKLTINNNIEMWSPREYNFSTDVIVLKDVSKSIVKKMTNLFNRYLENSEFRDFILEKTTSRSGYIPFYQYEDVVNKKDLEVSLEILLEFVANEFNEKGEELYDKMTESLSISFVSK